MVMRRCGIGNLRVGCISSNLFTCALKMCSLEQERDRCRYVLTQTDYGVAISPERCFVIRIRDGTYDTIPSALIIFAPVDTEMSFFCLEGTNVSGLEIINLGGV